VVSPNLVVVLLVVAGVVGGRVILARLVGLNTEHLHGIPAVWLLHTTEDEKLDLALKKYTTTMEAAF
jgi:hypothetical protein